MNKEQKLRSRTRLDHPIPVSETLDGAIRDLLPRQREKNRYVLHRLQLHWEDIVGAVNARHSGPVRLERATLYLDADGAVWSSELSMHRQEILDHIAAFCKAPRSGTCASTSARLSAAGGGRSPCQSGATSWTCRP